MRSAYSPPPNHTMLLRKEVLVNRVRVDYGWPTFEYCPNILYRPTYPLPSPSHS